jgi:hypothetical protein
MVSGDRSNNVSSSVCRLEWNKDINGGITGCLEWKDVRRIGTSKLNGLCFKFNSIL